MCLPAIVGWTKLGLWKSEIPFFPYLNFCRNKTRPQLFRRFWSELNIPSFGDQYLAGQILNFQIKGLWILLRKPCVSQNFATFTGLSLANVSGWQVKRVISTSHNVSHLPFTTPLCEFGGQPYSVWVLNLCLCFLVIVRWARLDLSRQLYRYIWLPLLAGDFCKKKLSHSFSPKIQVEQTWSSMDVFFFGSYKLHKWDRS